MITARTTNRANPSGSSTLLSTSNLIDALSDDSDVELIPASGESEISDYEDVSDATSPMTDSEQGNKGEMNSTSIPSLLSVLRAPKLSDLTRKRKIQSNPGKHKEVCASSSTSSEPKGVKAVDRVKKYLNEQLNVSAGKLSCKACREELQSL